MTRSASKQDLVRSLGAQPVVADALDSDAVAQAVACAEPEVIVHQLTALSGKMSIRDARHPDRSSMAKMTNRLRTEGTDHLLAAGRAAGARRFVAQSFGAFRFARTGGPVLTEADPLDPDPGGAGGTATAPGPGGGPDSGSAGTEATPSPWFSTADRPPRSALATLVVAEEAAATAAAAEAPPASSKRARRSPPTSTTTAPAAEAARASPRRTRSAPPVIEDGVGLSAGEWYSPSSAT
jgi:hypothetical protein